MDGARVKRYKWRALAGAWGPAAIALLIVGIPLFALVPAYEVNDDTLRSMAVSGMLSGAPSEHVLLTNVLIGFPLRELYKIFPEFDWYAAYLYCALLLASVGIIHVFLKACRLSPATVYLLIVILAILFRVALAPQYTTIAAACGAAGIGLIWLSACPGVRRGATILAGGAMVVLAVMIRVEIVPLLVVCCPVLILDDDRRRLLPAPLLSTAIAAGVVVGIDAWYYGRDPAWAEYFAFVNASELILDNEWASSKLDTLRQVVGWSRNDAIFFLRFVFMHEEVFSLEKVNAMIAALPSRESGDFWPIVAHEVRKGFLGENAVLAAALVMAAISALAGTGRRSRITIVIILITTLILTLAIAVQLKLPSWVVCAILLLSATSCVLAAGIGRVEGSPPARHSHVWRHMLVVLIFLGLAIPWTYLTVQRARENSTNDMGPIFQHLDEAYPPGAVFITFGRPPYHPMRPFRQDPAAAEVGLIVNAWHVRSPLYYAGLAHLGIDDPFASLWENPNVYALSESFLETMIPEFAQAHYGVTVEAERLDNLGGRFGDNFVWKFRPVKDYAAPSSHDDANEVGGAE